MDIEHLKVDYKENLSRAEKLRFEIVAQIQELLDLNDITLGVPIESRVKTWTDIEDKIDRKSLELSKITDLQDFVGVRLILLFNEDVTHVCSLISDNLDIVTSEDTATRLSESTFGYQSQHYIVTLPQKWLEVPSLSTFGDFYVELQVRTLAQHIWAAASHKLQYKNEQGVPPSIRRAIYRVSALLETVDLEFNRVLEERREYAEKTKDAPINQEPLNVDSLASILSKLLPAQNKGSDEPHAGLLKNLKALDVDSAEALNAIIERHRDAIMNAEAKQVSELQSGSKKFPSHDDKLKVQKRLDKGVFFKHVGLTREALRQEFGEQKADNIIKASELKPNTDHLTLD
jgi:ppGpp synthetase/RelA/SpoT-type nucleotidyltranferase